MQLEERAEPFNSTPWRLSAGLGAESTTWAPDSVQSRPPWQSTLPRIFNLVFVTSYVADSVDIVCFRNWLLNSSHHCHVILCESKSSAVSKWLTACTSGGRDEQELAFLDAWTVSFITLRDFVVTKITKSR